MSSKTVKLFITYDINVMTSYQYEEWISKTFGNDEIKETFEEVRDHFGCLKGFNVEVRCE